MKKYTEVFWAPWVNKIGDDPTCANTLYLPPTPLISFVHNNIETRDNNLLKCPAVKSVLQNDFVIRAPFDLTLTFDIETNSIFTDKYGQAFFDAEILNRSRIGGPVVLTIPPRYVFFSKENVEIMPMDLPLISSNSVQNIKIIPGKYNISKWCRPVDFTFTVINPSLPVSLKAEDPLWAVRFYTPNNVPVKMTRFELTPDFLHNVSSMTALKRFRRFLPLEKCYELAEGVMQIIKKKV